MQARTVIISAGVHVAIGWSLMHAEEQRKLRKPTDVTVSDEKKKEVKKEKPPPPKPPSPPAAPKPAAHPQPVAAVVAPLPTTLPAAAQAAAVSDLHFSNDGPGLEVGTGAKVQKPTSAEPVRARPVAAKPPPPPKETATECTEEATKPVPVVKTNPEYTDAARAAGIEGRLVVRVYVGADGSVTKVEVVSSVEPALDAAAIATIQKWRFTPAMKCGKGVDGGVFVFAQRFELAGD
jgi:protein TonB